MSIVEQALAPKQWLWTLNRPEKRNALRPQMLQWIAERAAALAGDVVVIRGAGGRVFSAGFDLNALPEAGHELGEQLPDEPLIQATRAMVNADATFVAAVDGPAIGAAVELLAVCDFQVAHTGTWCRVPAGALGVVYHPEGLARFHARLGSALARRMLLAGEKICADELHRAGFLSHLVDASDVGTKAHELAGALASADPTSTSSHRHMLRALDQYVQVGEDILQMHQKARLRAYRRLVTPKSTTR